MSRMYVIVNVAQGEEMKDLMMTLADKQYTFSVTDNISKLCSNCSIPSGTTKTKEEDKSENASVQDPESIEQSPTACNSTPSSPEVNSRDENVASEPTFPDDKPSIENYRNVNIYSHFDNLLPWGIPTSSSADFNLQQLGLFLNAIKEEVLDLPQEDKLVSPENDLYSNYLLPFKNSKQNVDLNKTPTSADLEAQQRKEHRGQCNLCKQAISTRTHHMRRHAITHLGYKTFQCKVCKMTFNRADICKPHFERHHPRVRQVPFEDVITREQLIQLEKTIRLCFPNEAK